MKRYHIRGYADFAALFWLGLFVGMCLGACSYGLAGYVYDNVDVSVKVK